MAGPFTWDATKPADTDYESAFPALDRQDKTNLANVLGTLTPLGAPTCGWRIVQVNNAMWMTQNARWTGTQWVVDDASIVASSLSFDPQDNDITLGWQPPGVSPFGAWQSMAIFSAAAGGSANYFQFIAQPAGATPQLTAQGADPNVGVNVLTKGTGTLQLNSQPLGYSTKATPGYLRLGPITLQWATTTINVTTANAWTSLAVTFPVAFSAAAYGIAFAPFNLDPTQTWGAASLTATGFTASIYPSGTGSYNTSWIAVGPS
jgi:hypothetical protein